MKNIRIIVFCILIFTYIAGIGIGSIAQIKTVKQEEMYSYLDSAVSQYSTTAAKSIKSAFFGNAKVLPFLAAGGLFKAGIVLIGGVLFVKGYAAGFAMTAVLRFYGMRGLMLCGGNIVSMMIFVPAAAYFGCAVFGCLTEKKYSRKKFLKHFLIMLLLLIIALCTDSLIRGSLSAVFMNFSTELLKKT